MVGLAGGHNAVLLEQQIKEFSPRYAYSLAPLELPPGVTRMPMEEMVCLEDVDLVMVATIGSVGLIPTFKRPETRQAGGSLQQRAHRDGGGTHQTVRKPVRWNRASRGQRAQRHLAVPSGGSQRDQPVVDYRFRRPVPVHSPGGIGCRLPGPGAEAPNVADGPEDHGRLRHVDEQSL